MNVGAPWPTPREAAARVQRNQAKLHRWATDDPRRRFDDLYNLVCDPATLLSAWRRVRANRGARSAGVDGETVRSIVERGEDVFLAELATLRNDSFSASKPGSTEADRVIARRGPMEAHVTRRWP